MITEIIKIALLHDGWLFVFATENFEEILDNYKWKVNGKEYVIRTHRVYDGDILNGKLNKFHAIMVGATDEFAKIGIWKKLYPNKYSRWMENMRNFIKKGGGYAGHCGGANLICGLYNEPETFYERMIDASDCGIVETKAYQKESLALLDQLSFHPPDALEGAAYPVYDGMSPDAPQMGGVPVDFIIHDKNHPIFKEYEGERVKIFWGGGPGLIAGKGAKIILKYPDDIHNIQPLHVWEYVGTGRGYIGKWIGVVKSVINEFTDRRERRIISRYLWKLCNRKISVEDFVYGIYKEADEKADEWFDKLATAIYKAKDWKRLDRIFHVKRAGMAGMVEETYGNGRIIMSGPHTEDKVWDDGRIIDVDDTKENCLWDGLMRWTNYGKKYYNEWILRREAAWISGLDEDELPPIEFAKIEKEKPVVKEKKEKSIIELLIRFFQRIFGR